MDILKWKFKTKIAILTPKLQFDVKIIDQTQISTIQDHNKLIFFFTELIVSIPNILSKHKCLH